tara:strand:- start:110 stop:1843 length:1734 start_codon:yes stop_codon:yes gene_type:complete
MANLKKKAAKRAGTGVAKNKFVRFHDSEGRPISVGAVKEFGGRPFTSWIEETEAWISDSEVVTFGTWYEGLAEKFSETFGERASEMMVAWLAAQQNVSPTGALGNVFRTEDHLAGFGSTKKAGLAEKKIISVLTGADLENGVAAKLADFVDAGHLTEFRSFTANAPEGGKPFVADVHTGRDSGHVDQQTLTRLKDMADGGNLLIDGVPVTAKVTKTKKTTKTDKKTGKKKTIIQPERVLFRGDGIKSFSVNVDLRGSPSDGTYEGISEWGNELTKHLNDIGWKGGNWEPRSIQAVGWMRALRQYDLPEGSVESALQENIDRVYAEVNYSSGSTLPKDFPDFKSLPGDVQSAVTRDVMNTIIPEIAAVVGGSTRLKGVTVGEGLFGGESAPSAAIHILGTPEASDLVTLILGIVSEQATTMSVRFGLGGKDSLGITVQKKDGTPLNQAEVSGLLAYTEIGGASTHELSDGQAIFMTDAKADYTPKGFTAKKGAEAVAGISSWAESAGIDLDVKLDSVRVTAYSNDWKNQTEGQSYRSVADARRNPVSPSESNRLRELYRTTLREALEAHSPKVGEVSR